MSRHKNPCRLLAYAVAVVTGLFVTLPASAFEWTTNEVHVQYGKYDIPSFMGGGEETKWILTMQHASG